MEARMFWFGIADNIFLIIGALIILIDCKVVAAYYHFKKSSQSQAFWSLDVLVFLLHFLVACLGFVIFGMGFSFFVIPLIFIVLAYNWVYNGNSERVKPIFADLFLLGLWFASLSLSAGGIAQGINFAVGLFCIHIVLLFMAILIKWPRQQQKSKEKNAPINKIALKSLGFSSLLLLSYLLPYPSYFGAQAFCRLQNQLAAEPIIEAIENYTSDNGVIPTQISELNLESPIQLCRNPLETLSGYDVEFVIDNCSGYGYALHLKTLSSDHIVYSLHLDAWQVVAAYDGCWEGGLSEWGKRHKLSPHPTLSPLRKERAKNMTLSRAGFLARPQIN
jgi:hypothetical protein